MDRLVKLVRRSLRPLRLVAGVCLCSVVLCSVVGCDRGDGRVAVSGVVRVDGTPLREGTVSFLPAAGTAGPSASAKVVDGRFDVARAHGPASGRYRLIVQTGDLVTAAPRRASSGDGRSLPAGERFEQLVETSDEGRNEFELEFTTSDRDRDGDPADAETDR